MYWLLMRITIPKIGNNGAMSPNSYKSYWVMELVDPKAGICVHPKCWR